MNDWSFLEQGERKRERHSVCRNAFGHVEATREREGGGEREVALSSLSIQACQFVSLLFLDLFSHVCGVSIVKDYGHVESSRGRGRERE